MVLCYSSLNEDSCIRTLERYTVTKMNELLIYSTIWMNLKYILLNETCQTQKVTYCMIPFM